MRHFCELGGPSQNNQVASLHRGRRSISHLVLTPRNVVNLKRPAEHTVQQYRIILPREEHANSIDANCVPHEPRSSLLPAVLRSARGRYRSPSYYLSYTRPCQLCNLIGRQESQSTINRSVGLSNARTVVATSRYYPCKNAPWAGENPGVLLHSWVVPARCQRSMAMSHVNTRIHPSLAPPLLSILAINTHMIGGLCEAAGRDRGPQQGAGKG